MHTLDVQEPPNYSRIRWQSALAAAICLGLPAGLVLWLILFQQFTGSAALKPLIEFLRAHGLYSIYFLVISSILWSYLLGRISGYRRWGWIAVATAAAILAVWFSPLANVDGILYHYRPGLPIHINYAASMVGLIGSVTLFVGLAYGFVLRSIKAALTMGFATSFVSMITLFLTIAVFDQLGIRVGTGNFAMSKVTVVGLLMSAITGGMVLGVEFSRSVREKPQLHAS